MAKDEVNIAVSQNANGSYVGSVDQATVTPNDKKHVHFNITTPGWQFDTAATAAGKYKSYTSPGSCGVYVDDPNNNFSLVEAEAQYVKLKDTKADSATMNDHAYAVYMKDGSGHTCVIDPVVRDKNN